MSEIQTEHQGYKIRYAENEEVWRCWDLDLQSKSLAALRTKIAAAARKLRVAQAAGLEVWVGNSWGGGDMKLGVIDALDPDGKRAAVFIGQAGGDGKRQRSKFDIANLLPRNPDQDAKIATMRSLLSEADRLRREADAIGKTLVRYTPETIAAAGAVVAVDE